MYQSLCDFSSPLTIYLMSDDLCCQEISSTCSHFLYLFSKSLLLFVHALHESLPIGAFLSNIFRVSCRAASYIADYTHTGTPENECPTLYNMSILSPPPTPQYLSVSWFCKGLLQNQYRSPNDEAIEGSDKTNTSGLRGKRWWCTQSD